MVYIVGFDQKFVKVLKASALKMSGFEIQKKDLLDSFNPNLAYLFSLRYKILEDVQVLFFDYRIRSVRLKIFIPPIG